jgi:hypothetical protein
MVEPASPGIPPLPPARDAGQDGAPVRVLPRYEDITEDGRFQLTALMPGLSAAVWRALLLGLPAIEAMRAQGILPILSRLVMVAEDRPASVSEAVEYRGSFRFAREAGGPRLFANMWVEARAPIASTLGPAPAADAPYALLGRVFAEHVITRPFAPPDQRRVTRLDVPGLPPIPDDEHPFEPPEALLARADGPLDDLGDLLFGAMHTDSNQHVNSMVYPRAFEEAAVRRLLQSGTAPAPQRLLARALELRWRRPFFAGERAAIGARFLGGAGAGVRAIGAFAPAGAGPGTRPSCAVDALFR